MTKVPGGLEVLAPQATATSGPRAPVLSVVVPCFDEAEVLPRFHARLRPVMEALGDPWEVVYVNDGSRDATLAAMLAIQEADPSRVSVLNLARNFGKEAALTAGLDHAAASGADRLERARRHGGQDGANFVGQEGLDAVGARQEEGGRIHRRIVAVNLGAAGPLAMLARWTPRSPRPSPRPSPRRPSS